MVINNPPQRIMLFLFILCIFLSAIPVFAQRSDAGGEGDFWICPSAEIAMYSIANLAYGGGVSLGYGRGASIGFKLSYLTDADGMVTTLEIDFLFRLYFFGRDRCSGPFVQLNAGPALFAQEKSLGIPAEIGIASAGLVFGWRFLLGRYFFLEPAIRAGYPYIVGVAFSGGFRY